MSKSFIYIASFLIVAAVIFYACVYYSNAKNDCNASLNRNKFNIITGCHEVPYNLSDYDPFSPR
mgnify:CR=1